MEKIKSPDFGRIVNEKHYNRLNELLEIHKNNIVFGGKVPKKIYTLNLQYLKISMFKIK